MISYVLGFAFSADLKHVVLIKKNGRSVPAHAGKLNGIGGKVYDGERLAVAMSREFEEETGVTIPASGWEHKGMFFGKDYVVEVCTTVSARVWEARTVETEQVCLIPIDKLYLFELCSNPTDKLFLFELCSNVPALIQICLNPGIKNLTWEER